MADETTYRLALFPRLEPRTPWTGGRTTDTDVMTLEEAARFASVHAGQEITPSDFLRAAARGEIRLQAIVHRSARTRPCAPGVKPLNNGEPVPAGSIPPLPIAACGQLAAVGRATWRTIERTKQDAKLPGEWWYFDAWELAPDEPSFETVPADCRVTGSDTHALADAFRLGHEREQPPEPATAPEPERLCPAPGTSEASAPAASEPGEPTEPAQRRRWTPELIAEARAFVARLTADGERAPMKVAAERFGVSKTRLRGLFAANPEPHAAGAHWPANATKRHRIN